VSQAVRQLEEQPRITGSIVNASWISHRAP
jgi:hypothetical protein